MEHIQIGPLHAIRFGNGPRRIVAAHGITASALAFSMVARHLPPEYSLISLDLRGRGRSNDLPGPFGMDSHAADICAVAEELGAPVTLTGHSMGAYAALRAAAKRPELFERLVLLDGGLPLPVPAGADPDYILSLTLGPALARLKETYESVDAYVAFFQAHPALAGEWNDDMTAYAKYDATGEPGAIRSRCSGAAVSEDGRDLLVNAASFGDDLLGLRVPVSLVYAPKGMFGQGPGMLPEPLVAAWAERRPDLHVELLEETNHYTILMTDRPAGAIAARLAED